MTLMIYTSTLNMVGLILIRLKKVWEDSRTLVVLTFLLLMATPMILDDYLIKNQESSLLALSIYYAFVFFNVNAFFLFSKIRLPFLFHVCVNITLGIYVFYPNLLLRYLIEPDMKLCFILIYAFPFLTSIPLMVGSMYFKYFGQNMVNPTAWKLPWNPWLLYLIMICCIPFKTYSLMMVYLPGKTIDPSISYSFYMPLFSVMAILCMNIGLWKNNRSYFRAFWICLLSGMVLSLYPFKNKNELRFVMQIFESYHFSHVYFIGVIFTLISFYAYIKELTHSKTFLLISIFLLSLIRTDTNHLQDLHQPNLWVLMLAILFEAWLLYRKWESKRAFIVLCILLYGSLQIMLPLNSMMWNLVLNSYLFTIGLMTVAFFSKDNFSNYLEYASAWMYPVIVFMNMRYFNAHSLWVLILTSLIITPFVLALIYSWRKKNLLLMYAFFMAWFSYIAFFVYLVIMKEDFYFERYSLLAGMFFLVFAIIVSFSKARVLRYDRVKTRIRPLYRRIRLMHYNTFKQGFGYVMAFFQLSAVAFLMIVVYANLLNLKP